MSRWEPERAQERQWGPERAKKSQWLPLPEREPIRARESERNPESARNWARVIPERARKRQRLQASIQKEKVVANLSGSISGSPWLSLACSLSLSGSLACSQALSGSLWLCSALTGPLWLSVALTLAPTDTLCHSLAQSGSLWLSLALYCSEISLIQSLLGSQRRCHADAHSSVCFSQMRHHSEIVIQIQCTLAEDGSIAYYSMRVAWHLFLRTNFEG